MWCGGCRKGAAVGGSINIGLSGEATVLAIGPCDVDSRETRPGMSIVTGTIRHRNATVWDLTFDDRTEETLGVTANHPLYSETRHAWIPAGDLQLDEVVRTLNGHSTLTARTQRPTRETVFNLEVHRSHAYHVSAIGVLAHNTGLPCPVATKGFRTLDHGGAHSAARLIEVEMANGTRLLVLYEEVWIGRTLFMKGTHIWGGTRGEFGKATLKQALKEFGQSMNARDVIVEPGVRSTGRMIGKFQSMWQQFME